MPSLTLAQEKLLRAVRQAPGHHITPAGEAYLAERDAKIAEPAEPEPGPDACPECHAPAGKLHRMSCSRGPGMVGGDVRELVRLDREGP